MGYRTKCVLEVPEDAIDAYKAANNWKDFKEIRGFFDGELLNDFDFAVLKKMYSELDGANWKKPWDLTNNHRSVGKWQGVTTVGDYITAIDLSSQGLKGELSDALFQLSHIETLNLSDNQISGDLGQLLAKADKNTLLTEVNLRGNQLRGDIYPFAQKLPNLKKLDVSYNQLTEISQVIPNTKLENGQFARGYQFVDWQTRKVVDGAPVIDLRPGTPAAIESNTLQTYRHEYGDHNYTFNDLARMQIRADGTSWDYYWELHKGNDGLWDVYSNDDNRVLHVAKGVPTVYTHTNPWWSYLTYILRFDWKDGDVNADETIDVTDLQSVIYYAMNDRKVSGQIFNYTTADANNDNRINVSDVVGSVDYVIGYEETAATPILYNRAGAAERNIVALNGDALTLTNTDAVAALQITVSGATARQLHVSEALSSGYSVVVRDVKDGVRIVLYSAEGKTLTAGQRQLLTGLPAGATVTDVRLSNSEARHLGVTIDNETTGLSTVSAPFTADGMPVYDLNGRRLADWDSLPKGIYIIRVNGKQYKVQK
jgi:hypothetical protein